MMAATSQYTRLRPTLSAYRPNANAPRQAAASIVLLRIASRSELRFQSLVIKVEAMPMTNRSYASVKKPIPEASTARR